MNPQSISAEKCVYCGGEIKIIRCHCDNQIKKFCKRCQRQHFNRQDFRNRRIRQARLPVPEAQADGGQAYPKINR